MAFDIDGTLYPSWKLYIRMPGYFLKNIRFFITFNRVRKVMHRTAPLPDFFEYQARLFAAELHVTPQEARAQIQRVCYEGLKPYFTRVRPYPHVLETVQALKAAGLKIGVLSDFPPEQKGDIWGIRPLCDACLGSEESGALKPSLYPFGILARALGVEPQSILYVGNSRRYDVAGAAGSGMKTGYLLKGPRRWLGIPLAGADISFKNYRQLRELVLE